MMKLVLNSTEMKAIDEYTIKTLGIPQEVLMERAAFEVVAVMKQQIKKDDRILVVCGSGNNGGDGIAAGRILYIQGYRVAILLIGEEGKGSEGFQRQLQIAKNLGMQFEHRSNLGEYNIMIDAIFGIGLSRPVTGIYEEIITKINEMKSVVYAIDIPSGISTDTGKVMNIAVRADYTVTFGYHKLGLLFYPGTDYAGTIKIADIGFGSIDQCGIHINTVYYDEEDLSLIPSRSNCGNKGTFGKVLVIAGSKGMSGAAYLSAKAAYRTGAGMVKIVTTEDNRIILQSILPEALFRAYDDSSVDATARKEGIQKDLDWADVIVFGPGIGITQTSSDLLDFVLENRNKPLVIDADGINLLSMKLDEQLKNINHNTVEELAGKGEKIKTTPVNERLGKLTTLLNGQIILTPHLKELSQLINKPISDIVNNLVDTAFQCSYNNNLIYAIKDARTIVTREGQKYINTSGNNGMATAGSGDVLTGMIAALIAQGMNLYDATCLGVYLHGLAGDEASGSKGKYSLMATDIVDHIETVLKKRDNIL